MAFSLFKRVDRRLAADLRSQRRNIVAGLFCVLVTSLLTTSTIGLIDVCVQAVQDASPIGRSAVDAFDPARRPGDEDPAVARLAERLRRSPEEVAAALSDAAPTGGRTREEALRFLGWMCLAIVGVYGLKYSFTRGQSLFLSRAASELAGELRVRMFRKIQRLPITYFNRTRSGEVQSILTNDVSVYQSAVTLIRDSLDGPVKAVSALAYIVYMQPALSLMAIGTFPIMWWFIQRNGRKMRAAQRAVQENLADVNAVAHEAIMGTRVVKAFAAEDRMVSLFEGKVRTALNSQIRAARRVASLRPMVELIGAVALALVLYVCGWLAFRGQLQISQIAALIFALDVINQGFRALGHVNNTYNQVQAASDRIYGQLLELPEEHAESKGTKTLPNPAGRVEFRNVWFRYPDGTEALRDVSFTLEPGTSLALVGPSGAGKSTIADLLLRFYDPSEGTILFDGVDLKELDQAWLRERIGVVPQQNFLFAGTLADNIRLGKEDASDTEIEEAGRIAHADVFVEKLPGAYGSTIGEGGIGLSGGERQRVAIARALVRQPTVLLLDEATSALDAHSEQAVQEALDEVMRQRTTLFIAHRLTTAARADRILVLRRGEVIEQGSHRELMAQDGAYAGMYRAFSSGVLEGDLV